MNTGSASMHELSSNTDDCCENTHKYNFDEMYQTPSKSRKIYESIDSHSESFLSQKQSRKLRPNVIMNEVHNEKDSAGLSPFSKHYANLSPLYKHNGASCKPSKLRSSSKFSVEFMKSPVHEGFSLNAGAHLLNECTPGKINFGEIDRFEINDTPTFNSQHDEQIDNINDFGFLTEKENIDANRVPKFDIYSQEDVPSNPDDKEVEEKWRELQQNKVVQQISQLNEIKSRGSTSPGSNAYPKNSIAKTNVSSHRKDSLVHRFIVSGKRDRECSPETLKFSVSKHNRRLEKTSYKNAEILKSESKAEDTQEFKGCNCKKSQCKKLYCECFQNKRMCTSQCACCDCCNTHENEELIVALRKAIQKKNPNAFKDVQNATNEHKHVNGCKCKKSKCVTGYCECHQLGAKCSELCKCQECHNQPSSVALATPTKKQD